jgi:hypothetical protein
MGFPLGELMTSVLSWRDGFINTPGARSSRWAFSLSGRAPFGRLDRGERVGMPATDPKRQHALQQLCCGPASGDRTCFVVLVVELGPTRWRLPGFEMQRLVLAAVGRELGDLLATAGPSTSNRSAAEMRDRSGARFRWQAPRPHDQSASKFLHASGSLSSPLASKVMRS